MGTSPRSLGKRVTRLAAVALGAAVAAAIVARRRTAPPPLRHVPAGPARSGAVGAAEPPGHSSPDELDLPEDEPADASGDTADASGDTAGAFGDAAEAAVQPPDAAEAAGPPPDVTEAAVHPPVVGGYGGAPHVARRAAAGVVLLAALTAGLGLTVLDGDDDAREAPRVDATVTTPGEPTTTQLTDDMSPQDAFTRAAERLVSAGSFRYVGTTTATDVSHVRPGLWLAVDLTVEGEVATAAGRVHEIAVDDRGRASETVTEGPVVWSRLATSRETLADVTYLPITEESGAQPLGKSMALLPTWLESTVDRRDAGTDDLGRRVLRAVLPAAALGEIVDGQPAGDAEVVLTLDPVGDPVSVLVTSVPTGPPLRLALDVTAIGQPVAIDLPADGPGQP